MHQQKQRTREEHDPRGSQLSPLPPCVVPWPHDISLRRQNILPPIFRYTPRGLRIIRDTPRPRLQDLRDDVRSFSGHRDHRPVSSYPSTFPSFSRIFISLSSTLDIPHLPDEHHILTDVIERVLSLLLCLATPYSNYVPLKA